MKYKFSLTLDDFAPHINSGLNFESIYWCNKLISKYPDIKVDLFVPAAYCRLGERPCYLSRNLNWVEKVKSLSDNYSINMHGLFHRRQGDKKHLNSNNDEFQFLNRYQAIRIIDTMIGEFETVGLKYNRVFRPPAWKISLSVVEELTKRGFVIAGDNVYYNKYKNKVKNLKWVSYNWDMTSECKVKGDIVAFGHMSNWTNNYMDEKRYDMICKLLDNGEYEFKFVKNI